MSENKSHRCPKHPDNDNVLVKLDKTGKASLVRCFICEPKG